jgi:hypothetical protein
MGGKITAWKGLELGRPTTRKELDSLTADRDRAFKWYGIMQRESRSLRNICEESSVKDMFKIMKRCKVQLDSVKKKIGKWDADLREAEFENEKKKVKEEGGEFLRRLAELEEKVSKQ